MFLNKIKNKLLDDAVYFYFFLGFIFSTYIFVIKPVLLNPKIRIYPPIVIFIFALLVVFGRYLRVGFKLSIDEKIVLIFAALSFLFSLINNTGDFLDYLQPIGIIITYFAVSSYLHSAKSMELEIIKLLKVFVVLSLIQALFSFILILPNLSTVMKMNPYARAIAMQGIMYNPNPFGFQMLLGLLPSVALFFHYVFRKKNFNKGVVLFAIIQILMVFLFFSVSRSSVISFFLFLLFTVFYLVFFKDGFKLDYKITALSILFLLLMLFVLQYDSLWSAIIGKMSRGSSNRTVIWGKFFLYYKTNFPSLDLFIGQGYDTFIKFVSANLMKNQPHTHNFLLDIWGKFGIINLFLILYYFYVVLRVTLRNSRYWYIMFIPVIMIVRDMVEADIFLFAMRWEFVVFFIVLLAPFYDRAKPLEQKNGNV